MTEQTFPIGTSDTVINLSSYNLQQYEFQSAGSLKTITMEFASTSSCFTGSSCQLNFYHDASLQSFFNETGTSTVSGHNYVTFTSTNAGASTTVATATHYQISGNFGGGMFGHTNSTTYTNTDHFDQNCSSATAWSCSGAGANSDEWIAFNMFLSGGSLPYLSINSPTTNSFVPNGTLTVSGYCPTNASSQVLVRTGVRFYDITTSTFDTQAVSCVDGAYTASVNVLDGLQAVNVLDRSWLASRSEPTLNCVGNAVCQIAVNGVDSNYAWSIGILKPLDDGTHNFTGLGYASGTFPFRFSYRVPSNVTSSQVFFGLQKTDATFTGGTTLTNSTLFTLDSNRNGYIDLANLTASSTQTFYSATLSYNSVVYYTLNFTVLGSASGTVPLASGQKDYGFWGNILRDAFVPQPSTLDQFTSGLPAMFHDKIVVGYYYQVKDAWSATPVTTDFQWHMTIPSVGGSTSSTLTIFDSSSTILSPYLTSFRTLISAILWIVFAIYVIERLMHFEF